MKNHKRFPQYIWFRLTFLLISGFSFGVAAIGVIGQHNVVNLFSEYNWLFEEDGVETALMYGFACRDIVSSGTSTCIQSDTNGAFGEIYLWFSEGQITEAAFQLQKNTFIYGDLAALWGIPDVKTYCGKTLVLSWQSAHITAFTQWTHTRRVSYFLPIQSISFRRDGLSNAEQLLMSNRLGNCS